MSKESTLKREYKTEEDWFEGIFSESNSQASLDSAKTALKPFDLFCKAKLEIPDPDISDLKKQRLKKLM